MLDLLDIICKKFVDLIAQEELVTIVYLSILLNSIVQSNDHIKREKDILDYQRSPENLY